MTFSQLWTLERFQFSYFWLIIYSLWYYWPWYIAPPFVGCIVFLGAAWCSEQPPLVLAGPDRSTKNRAVYFSLNETLCIPLLLNLCWQSLLNTFLLVLLLEWKWGCLDWGCLWVTTVLKYLKQAGNSFATSANRLTVGRGNQFILNLKKEDSIQKWRLMDNSLIETWLVIFINQNFL